MGTLKFLHVKYTMLFEQCTHVAGFVGTYYVILCITGKVDLSGKVYTNVFMEFLLDCSNHASYYGHKLSFKCMLLLCLLRYVPHCRLSERCSVVSTEYVAPHVIPVVSIQYATFNYRVFIILHSGVFGISMSTFTVMVFRSLYIYICIICLFWSVVFFNVLPDTKERFALKQGVLRKTDNTYKTKIKPVRITTEGLSFCTY